MRDSAVSARHIDDQRFDASEIKARGARPDAPRIAPAWAVAGDLMAHGAFAAHPKQFLCRA